MKKLVLPIFLLTISIQLFSQPTAITWQGKLLDADGNAITQNNVAMTFAMFDAGINGIQLWPTSGVVTKTVDVNQGLYSVQLGTGAGDDIAFTASMFDGKTPWLEVKVGTETLPRTEITNVPFALISNELSSSGWENPGEIGKTTPNTGKFTSVETEGLKVTTGASDGKVLTSDADGNASWTTPYTGLTNFTESNFNYNSERGVKFTPNNAGIDVDFVIQPKGAGAILAQQPDGTSTGGNNRGPNSVDLQTIRMDASSIASGTNSTIIGGRYNTASGRTSTAMGSGTTASGTFSTAMGVATQASGAYSLSTGFGTQASGDYTTAIGAGTTAPSAFESVSGSFNTNYTPSSTSNWISTDRLFVVGNGTANDSRSNALTIFKNANTTIGGSLTLNGNGTNSSFTFPTERGTSGQVLQTDGSGATSWTTPSTGSVTGVSATLPIVSTGGTTPAISINPATTSEAGSMSAADKTKLNGLVSSQWTTNGSNIHFNSGYVGLGNTVPRNKLHITTSGQGDNSSTFALRLENDDFGYTSTGLAFSVEGGEYDYAKAGIAFQRTDTYARGKLHFLISNATNTNDVLFSESAITIDKTGYIGIGTTNPGSRLTLGNNIGDGFDDWTDYQLLLFTGGTAQSSYGLGVKASTLAFNSDSDFDFDQDGSTVMTIQSGNVGIGTTTTTQKLNVNGNVLIPSGSSYWIGNAGDAGNRLRLHQSGTNAYIDWGEDDLFFRSGESSTTNRVVFTGDGKVGIGTTTPKANLDLGNNVANRKIALYTSADNDHQFTGFGLNNDALRFQLANTSGNFKFYGAISVNTSTELFRIQGNGQIVIPALTTSGVLLNSSSGVISSTIGTSGQVLSTNGSGGISWITPYSGLANFTESNYTYNSRTGVKLTPNVAQANVDFIVQPKGNGAIIATQPDGTASGGNNRGIDAVDLQIARTSAEQVASGEYSFIGGGSLNKASGGASAIPGGYLNTSSGVRSAIPGGAFNAAMGNYSFTSGYYNVSRSYGETVMGLFATDVAGDNDSFVLNDRLFTIGNGTDIDVRSSAFTILKNANTTVGGSLTINGNLTNASIAFPTGRGSNGQVLTTFGNGNTSWASIVGSQWTTGGSGIYYNAGNVGIGTTNPQAPLQFANNISARKIVLWSSVDNDHQFYGFGVNNSTLRYQINSSSDNHVFFAGTSPTTSSELFRIQGDGDVVAQGQIKNVTDPTDAQDAATKSYVDDKSPETYQVGDFAQGGIVFWVDGTGQHGLICAKSDQSTAITWSAGAAAFTMAKGDGPMAGYMNTAIIIGRQGYGNGSNYAARLCNETRITENSIEYGDWYLPSTNELQIMYNNRTTINATATNNGGDAFAIGRYWASTEYNDSNAWTWNFSTGSPSSSGKTNGYRVRAVRTF